MARVLDRGRKIRCACEGEAQFCKGLYSSQRTNLIHMPDHGWITPSVSVCGSRLAGASLEAERRARPSGQLETMTMFFNIVSGAM
jgi:hypothetical protein